MLGMNTFGAKEPVETTPYQWPTEIGEQMAAAHRIYPVVDSAADPRLIELLKVVEELRATHGRFRHQCDPTKEKRRGRLWKARPRQQGCLSMQSFRL
jgi:hypothetical protein